jgi:hypothetical protein
MPPRPSSGTTPPPPPPPPPSPSKSSGGGGNSIAGRVARLHFSCRAAIPMGSSLRVSTTLDASSSAAMSGTTGGSSSGDVQATYQNSIEMITTPELYPIFKTKRPVIVVLHHPSHRKNVQHHYYRYMVVSPAVFDNGTTMNNNNPSTAAGGGGGSDDPTRQYSTMVQTEYGYPGLVQFENPFSSTTSTGGGTTSMKSNSAVSLASSVVTRGGGDAGGTTSTSIAALPFRMVDIRVDTADVAESIDDIWDNPDDVTFQPFRIRDAVRFSSIYIFDYLIPLFHHISLSPTTNWNQSSFTTIFHPIHSFF